MYRSTDIICIFNRLYEDSYNTILVGGGDEPLYVPANDLCEKNRLIFAHEFFASALHEVAHWCVAGLERRKLTDFGYWYISDGRDERQQRSFEVVEVLPQALEWIFSKSAGYRFRVSTDNLSGDGAESADCTEFKAKVFTEAGRLLDRGLPARAEAFARTLIDFYETDIKLDTEILALNEL